MSSVRENAVRIETASAPDLESIRRLLESADLPHVDLPPACLEMFLYAKSGEDLVGVIGLEAYEQMGLVRSLAVAPSHRGRGIASSLLAEAETLARRHGMRTLYGLTETIEPLLLRRGYRRVARDEAPEAIRETAEFRTLCPMTAVLLTKTLAG